MPARLLVVDQPQPASALVVALDGSTAGVVFAFKYLPHRSLMTETGLLVYLRKTTLYNPTTTPDLRPMVSAYKTASIPSLVTGLS